MDSKSMFSINTFQTSHHPAGSNSVAHHNQLHEYFYALLPVFATEYPYLSKIFYLQLVLRENFLLFTEDRVDVRDIWLAIARKLGLPKPDMYVVDQGIKIQEIISTKSEYQRVMLHDVDKLSIQNVNKILNMGLQTSNVSFIAIQNPKQPIKPHIADLFSMTFFYHSQQQITQLMDTISISKQTQDNQQQFDKKKFNQCVKYNFQVALQQVEEEGFMKPFMVVFEEILKKNGVEVSQSRWKKMFKVLKFVGVNKHQGNFKRVSLPDFAMTPQLLASSYEEHERLTKTMREAMRLFLPFFGSLKFQRSIKSHFFVSPANINYLKEVCSELKHHVSFFYPCSKFAETAAIHVEKAKKSEESSEELSLAYKINGFQKKIKSDHHLEIKNGAAYRLSMKFMANCPMTVHLGIACFDVGKNYIDPIQACRKRNSQVVFERLEGQYLYVSGSQNLHNWAKNSQESFAFERAIGIYPNGDTSCVPQISNIIFNKKEPYSKQNMPFLKIQEDRILLSNISRQWFANFKHILVKGKSIFMNHFEGQQSIGETFSLEKGVEKSLQIQYKGLEFENNGRNFFPETKFVRVIGLINYNSGYPDYKIQQKNGQFFFKQITWTQI